jgi:hypothetical protein
LTRPTILRLTFRSSIFAKARFNASPSDVDRKLTISLLARRRCIFEEIGNRNP